MTPLYFLWLFTSGYAVNVGAYPDMATCHQIATVVEKGLGETGGKLACVESLAGVAPFTPSTPGAPAASAKPEQGSLPAAPALLKNGLRLIRG